ncbi:phosphate acyltransferase PlsX [Coxiella endosymbiont of Amblyomma americanum]|uniref:phosphate acyltransferase PlsX n=1 Tax=Coxiella endosymbiont of Amblyomma americanum TaxID=325775 RepID=UPI00058060CA|nr:phosphate acyltransferase PlsX [Coxiella endosymbiont of Amblyomma americanum]AJC50654.1 phosphate acyltransferase [Coxiella endosymbiont of Amblyomma americanum]AUJ58982.1 phosphate acyltransferase [Coxiella-like endosymbiont of Amblyomma americanum]
MKTIALDAMGGDHGPKVVVPAALLILKKYPDVKILLVGKEEQLRPLLVNDESDTVGDRWRIIHADEEVSMDEIPSQVLRTKKHSSMRVAINLVKEGRAQACVSAGNTGALMVTARHVLKTLPGIDRPAIVASFPTKNAQEVRVLDLGANVDSSPENLYQFAVMGSILVTASDDLQRPKVGLLNIGEEEIKGNELVKKANGLFEKSKVINYIGYIEGDSIFNNIANVVVCDGFVGNVVLKAMEGVIQLLTQYARSAFKEAWWTKLMMFPAIPIFKRLIQKIDPERYNGATFLGLNAIVIKSHGSANIYGFFSAVEEAIFEIDKNIPKLIKERVGSFLEESKIS